MEQKQEPTENDKGPHATFTEKDGKFIVTPIKPTISDIFKQYEQGLIDEDYCKMLISVWLTKK